MAGGLLAALVVAACASCGPARDAPDPTTSGGSIESDLREIESTLDAIETELNGG